MISCPLLAVLDVRHRPVLHRGGQARAELLVCDSHRDVVLDGLADRLRHRYTVGLSDLLECFRLLSWQG